jgi:uncharacterized protein (TIGR03067 family)
VAAGDLFEPLPELAVAGGRLGELEFSGGRLDVLCARRRLMKQFWMVFASTIGLFLAVTVSHSGDKLNKKEMEKFQGTWKPISIEGLSVPEKIDAIRVTIKGEKLIVEGLAKEPVELTYKLDASKNPKAIDIGFGGGVVPGIYEFDKDKLRVCHSAIPVQNRPTDFTAKAGSKQYLWVLKREKR